MDLRLPIERATGVRSKPQIARVVTEGWVEENLYCPACTCESLTPYRPGKRVVDFHCESCEERFQLKSQSQPFRQKVVDAAYEPMRDAILGGTAPSFLFLRYVPWVVDYLFVTPRHFLSSSFLEPRRRLGPTARRAGWWGCNLVLDAVPPEGRIPMVECGNAIPLDDVRAGWRRFDFLRQRRVEQRGWFADMLACVRRLGKDRFTLSEVYAFESELGAKHRKNQHVRPKIRQQLQVLRDHGVVKFEGRGRYRLMD